MKGLVFKNRDVGVGQAEGGLMDTWCEGSEEVSQVEVCHQIGRLRNRELYGFPCDNFFLLL